MGMLLAYNFVLSLAGVVMILAAGSDLARFKIPNITLIILLLLFPLFVFVSPVTVNWPMYLLTFAIILALGYALYAKNLAGAGDIKMIAVVALWAGPHYLGHFLFITALTGGILGATLAVISHLRLQLSKTEEEKPVSPKPIPYGVAIALGGLCTLVLLSHPALLTSNG